jgi:hypothetical protein
MNDFKISEEAVSALCVTIVISAILTAAILITGMVVTYKTDQALIEHAKGTP